MSKSEDKTPDVDDAGDASKRTQISLKLPKKASERIARIGRWEERSARKFLTAPGG